MINILEHFPQPARTALAGFDLLDEFTVERGSRQTRPVGSIRFLLVGEWTDSDFQAFPKPQAMNMVQTPSGIHAFTGTVADGKGAVPITLRDGVYSVRVVSRFYRPLQIDKLRIPPPRDQLATALVTHQLVPNHSYPFPTGSRRVAATLLRGGIRGVVSTATVSVSGTAGGETFQKEYATDSGGEWALAFPEAVFGELGPGIPPERVSDVPVDVTALLPNGSVKQQAAVLKKGTTTSMLFDFT